MKKAKVQDERVGLLHGKISSEALTVVTLTLVIMGIVQLNAPFKQVMGELITLLVLGVYLFVRSLMIGLDFLDESTKKRIIVSLLVGLFVMTTGGFNNYSRYGSFYQHDKNFIFIQVLGILFISGFILTYVILSILSYLNTKRHQDIKKKLDDEENRID